jgi:hypothetical protein
LQTCTSLVSSSEARVVAPPKHTHTRQHLHTHFLHTCTATHAAHHMDGGTEQNTHARLRAPSSHAAMHPCAAQPPPTPPPIQQGSTPQQLSPPTQPRSTGIRLTCMHASCMCAQPCQRVADGWPTHRPGHSPYSIRSMYAACQTINGGASSLEHASWHGQPLAGRSCMAPNEPPSANTST